MTDLGPDEAQALHNICQAVDELGRILDPDYATALPHPWPPVITRACRPALELVQALTLIHGALDKLAKTVRAQRNA